MPKFVSRLDVMNLQVLRRAAVLAAPIVSTENLSAHFLVRFRIQRVCGDVFGMHAGLSQRAFSRWPCVKAPFQSARLLLWCWAEE